MFALLKLRNVLVTAWVIALSWSAPALPQEAAQLSDRSTAQGVVEELYGLVTFDAGATPDWDIVRSLFIPEATVVLRTGRTETTVFSLEGFVQDFVNFIERANVVETGFSERIIDTHGTVFGDMANIWVLYEAHIPGSPRPPQQGVDSFQLIRKEGRWWIVSITNELPTPDRPVPEFFRGN